jgi:hypothetical protein
MEHNRSGVIGCAAAPMKEDTWDLSYSNFPHLIDQFASWNK